MTHQADYSRRKSNEAADLGKMPPCLRPDDVRRWRYDLNAFLREAFPNSTGLKPFAQCQIDANLRLEEALVHGGRLLDLEPRGYAKSARSVRAAIWALCYGHRDYVVLLSPNARLRTQNMVAIKSELEDNQILFEAFPHLCYPIRALEGKPQRCASQHFRGVPTNIQWTSEQIVLPSIDEPPENWPEDVPYKHGWVLLCLPLKSARGPNWTLPTGEVLRPDFVLIDDPQTSRDARSAPEIVARLGAIRREASRMGGHSRPLAMACVATVVAPDDVVDQLSKDPSWPVIRSKMLVSKSKAEETHWLGEYRRLRQSYDAGDASGRRHAMQAATAYYVANRAVMDEGAEASWEWCYHWGDGSEVSAIQHAYNILIDDGPEAFASECQNEPLLPAEELDRLKPEQVRERVSGLKRGEVPQACQRLTAFVDLGDRVLWWMVCGWADGFSGQIVDYGTWPPQRVGQFTQSNAPATLRRKYPGTGPEGAVQRGLEDLLRELTAREFPRQGGGLLTVERTLVDVGYKPEIVSAVKTKLAAATIEQARGRGLKAGDAPMALWPRKPGDEPGFHWHVTRGVQKAYPTTVVDVNFWKTFAHSRLTTSPGDPGSLTLFGRDPEAHRLVAEHIANSEIYTLTEGERSGGKVHEWSLRPGKPDNHWFDCLVGCCVGASRCGVTLAGQHVTVQRKRKRYTQADLRRRA